MRAEFDSSAFARDVKRWLERKGCSYRAAAAEHPLLNLPMLSRAVHERKLSVVNVLVLCRVVGLDPMNYLNMATENAAKSNCFSNRQT
ncbi:MULTISPECIES: hypothetical protein [unclassified Rhizobium]|uniref:hypothetical protein n=1 Tax=unclassified Rhizobium TaxID=2613769 RepID=UPI00040DD642|nr:MULTISPECIES: hypothetical protein [unclassified Rhizobium]MBB3297872.1 hypothetical protein [Rhizobium sp. BK112]MBB4177633.1 hypothetical protein [Rhizobium sp. BK109]